MTQNKESWPALEEWHHVSPGNRFLKKMAELAIGFILAVR
jgi:hypothetical protein